MCTVLLTPGVNLIAVDKYIISYHISITDTDIHTKLRMRIQVWNVMLWWWVKGSDVLKVECRNLQETWV